MSTFKAFWVEKTDAGVVHSVIERDVGDLPEGEVLVRVKFSSVNFKDALSARGMPGVTRNYPHTPGIDAAGVVQESSHRAFKAGDAVIVIGYDLGMDTPGGFGEYIRVPAGWVVPLPRGMTLRESMIIGTAGFTAALCLEKLLIMGARPADGPVVVTGATGGVGSVAVALLASQGFDVIASSGKTDKVGYLKALGAKEVTGRNALSQENPRPLADMQYAHAIDTVGGEILANVIKSLNYGGSVAICGLVASPRFNITVLPFILRNVNILGIDSVELPIAARQATWKRLASDWKLTSLEDMAIETRLDSLSDAIDTIFDGGVSGRTLVVHDGD